MEWAPLLRMENDYTGYFHQILRKKDKTTASCLKWPKLEGRLCAQQSISRHCAGTSKLFCKTGYKLWFLGALPLHWISDYSSFPNYFSSSIKTRYVLPWLVWLSGLSASLQTKVSPVQFPVRAHAWVAGQVPSRGRTRGNHTLMFVSLSFSLPSPL